MQRTATLGPQHNKCKSMYDTYRREQTPKRRSNLLEFKDVLPTVHDGLQTCLQIMAPRCKPTGRHENAKQNMK